MGKCFLLKVRWGAVPHGGVGVGLRTGACGDAPVLSTTFARCHCSHMTHNNLLLEIVCYNSVHI
jgi:hypothetical protein